MTRRADIAVIGAGMAGASLAAELAAHASVLLIEGEDRPGYHSTGRSAAFWAETYGGPLVQPLTTASGPWLEERGMLYSRGAVHLAQAEGGDALSALEQQFEAASVPLRRLGRPELERAVPGLRPGWDAGLFEPSCADIDVAALHEHYLRGLRGSLACGAPVERIERAGEGWRIEAGGERIEAGILVNAAGAWADEVAVLAGAAPLGVRPYRRTIVQLRMAPPPPSSLPLVIDALGRFYFKPEAGGRLWLSPHDETPCAPADCAAEEYDVALAIDRLQRTVDWTVERVEHSWAGLRSFAPDRLPVYGFAPERPGFFWCAGQGGFGIQTAPAAAKLAAALLLGTAAEPMVAAINPAPYLPDRFSR